MTRSGERAAPTGEATRRTRLPAQPDVWRIAGLAYLGLAVCGLLGNVVIRNELESADDPSRTAANLVEHEGLARLGIAMEVGAVLTQAVVAWCLFIAFRRVHRTSAVAIAAFGMTGAAGLLVAAALTATALDVALDAAPTSPHDVQLLYDLNGQTWQVAGIFFGLWLIPMGLAVLRSGFMPRLLGWLLAVGGAGYVVHPFVAASFDAPGSSADVLLIPSTIGELWMIGYLLARGDRGDRRAASTTGDRAEAREP